MTGDEPSDLEAVASYVASVARSLPPRQAETVLSAALRGMIQDLADPLAAIFLPVQFAEYMEDLRGEHGGIGAQLDLAAGQIVISDVTPGGPAARAGISAGDILLEINGRPTAERTPATGSSNRLSSASPSSQWVCLKSASSVRRRGNSRTGISSRP